MLTENIKLLPISVIVPTYNDGEQLQVAILSVVDQSYPPEKLIVVDDGSHSGVAREIVEKIKRIGFKTEILYIYKENGGPSSARNRGLDHVDSPFVAFLDSDDKILPGSLNVMLQALQKLPHDYFGVYGTHLDKSTQRPYPYGDFDGVVSPDLVGKKKGIAGGVHTYLFKTEHLIQIGKFDEDLVNNEDFDLIIRLLLRGWKCKGKITPVFERNYRDNSVSRPSDPYKAYAGIKKFLLKAKSDGYFSEKEFQSRFKGVELSLAKSYYCNGDFIKAKNVLNNSIGLFPSNKRELKFIGLYCYLSVRCLFR